MEPRVKKNEGVIVTGGSITAGNLAVGRRATVVAAAREASAALESRGQDELAEKLSAMIEALSQHSSALENATSMLSSGLQVAEELKKNKPDKPSLLAMLGTLADGARSLTGLAVAVEALKHAVTSFL
jgi:hypothetical protein